MHMANCSPLFEFIMREFFYWCKIEFHSLVIAPWMYINFRITANQPQLIPRKLPPLRLPIRLFVLLIVQLSELKVQLFFAEYRAETDQGRFATCHARPWVTKRLHWFLVE